MPSLVSRSLFASLTCAACFLPQPICAIGPTLPIEIAAEDEHHGWEVTLRVDTRQARIVKIERQIHSRGEELRVDAIEPKYDKQAAGDRTLAVATLNLRTTEMEKLKPGAYAQKVVIEGQWLPEGSGKPLRIERWFYFIVKEGRVERIDAEQYGNLTDRAEVTMDSRGRRSFVKQGQESKGLQADSKEKPSQATPLGHLGGAAEEDVPEHRGRVAEAKDKPDQSEAQED